MRTTRLHSSGVRPSAGERGAALITVLLMSTLLLAAGGALVLTTMGSATGAFDATGEAQAYYAAESGLQATLGVLRGHGAPNPLFDADPAALANKISFRRAINSATSNTSGTGTPRLTRWLNYHATYTDRVAISPGYNPVTGMAYTVESVTDPDGSDVVTFSTSGAASTTCPAAGTPNFTLTYTPRASTVLNTGGATTGTTLGSLQVTAVSLPGTVTIAQADAVTLNLNVTQTTPWAGTTVIPVKIFGSVTRSLLGTITPDLTIRFPKLDYNVGGVRYSVPALDLPITTTNAVTIAASATPPEPNRLLVKVRGFGPRGASKRMQMLVNKYAFNYTAAAAITLRSSDDNSVMTFDGGSSAPHLYDGNDNAGGPPLPAVSVTNDPDYNLIDDLSNAAGASPAVQKVPIPSLALFLQTTTGPLGARAQLDFLRQSARNQIWPPNCLETGTRDACDRYFPAGSAPTYLGENEPNGLLTFVDGDFELPTGGGAGMLVVTGTLTARGNADYKGLILALGAGVVRRNGGGNGLSLGSIVVARFDPVAGNFLAPTFDVNGGGTSDIKYDSEWVRRALMALGPSVVGVSEY